MKEKLLKVLGWFKGQTKVHWMKMLHTYMWIYGVYMVLTAVIYMYRGVVDDPVWFNVGTERIFGAMWFGMYWLMQSLNSRTIKMYREMIDMDDKLVKSYQNLAEEQHSKIIALTAENNTLKALQPAQSSS